MSGNKGKQHSNQVSAGPITEVAKKSYSARVLAIVLAIVAFVVYANTLNNGYVLDDVTAITRNRLVQQGVSSIPELLTTPYHHGFHPSDNDLYRPLSLVMFAVEQQVFPGRPFVGHFVNVLLFLGCVLALFRFLSRLTGDENRVVAFVGALLFAVHPIHTEVVANIKSRDELLCFFFAFLSLNQFARYAAGSSVRSVALGALCLLLSLLSKESSVTFIVVIPLVFFFFLGEDRRRSTAIAGSTVAVVVLYLFARHAVLSAHHANVTSTIPFVDNALVKVPEGASRFATAVLILGIYLRLLFVPWPLVCDYSFDSVPYAGFTSPGFLFSLVIYAALFVVAVLRLARFKKDLLAFAILFFLVTLSLFSNVFFLLGATMAERFLFFASAGFCFALALLLSRWLVGRGYTGEMMLSSGIARAALLIVVVSSGIVTISRNGEWVDNTTLYSADIVKAPRNMRLHWFLGNELTTTVFAQETNLAVKRSVMEKGISELRQALAIYPDMLPAHEDLGHAYFMVQQFDSAMYHSRKVLEQDPHNAIALFNISGVFFSTEKYDSAIAYCHMAAKSDPGNFDIPRNIAFSWLQLGKFDSSILYFKKVLARYPDDAFCNSFLAKAYQGAGFPDSNRKYEMMARFSTH